MDENLALRRYHDMCITVLTHAPQKAQKPKLFEDAGMVFFAATYAIAGNEYFTEMQGHINYTILQAALLLTVTLASFFEPVDFDTVSRRDAYILLMGISSISYLTTIMLCTVYATALMRPWKQTDAMMVRMNYTETFKMATFLNYAGTTCLLVAMMLLGFEFGDTIGYIMLIGAVLALYVIFQWIYTSNAVMGIQLQNMEIFRQHYLDDNGMLRPEFLCKIDQSLHFPPTTSSPPSCDSAVSAMLGKIHLTQYEQKFIEHEITSDQLPFLDHDLLGAIGVDKVGHRLSILRAIEADSRARQTPDLAECYKHNEQ